MPAAHFQIAQWLLMMIPMPKEELASHHQLILIGAWQVRGMEGGDIDMMKQIHDRSAVTAGGRRSLPQAVQKPWEK